MFRFAIVNFVVWRCTLLFGFPRKIDSRTDALRDVFFSQVDTFQRSMMLVRCCRQHYCLLFDEVVTVISKTSYCQGKRSIHHSSSFLASML